MMKVITTSAWAVEHQRQRAPSSTISTNTRYMTVTRPMADHARCHLTSAGERRPLSCASASAALTVYQAMPAAEVGSPEPTMTEYGLLRTRSQLMIPVVVHTSGNAA